MFASFANTASRARRQTLENKILYLIQLWADTFMMYEDSFPHFLSVYRMLRKEGVVFPPRESNTRFMLSSMGLESPMFDFLAENSKSKVPQGPSPPKRKSANFASEPVRGPAFCMKEMESKCLADAERDFKKFAGGMVSAVSHERDTDKLAKVVLSNADIETIKSYMQIIDEICVNAEHLKDMKTELALECYKYCQAVHARCISLISAKSTFGVEYQMEVLLSLSEDLDVRVKLFKNTFIDLSIKDKGVILTGSTPPTVARKSSSKKQVSGSINQFSPRIDPNNEESKSKISPLKPKPIIKPLPPPPSNPFFQFETKVEPLLDLLENEPAAPINVPKPEEKIPKKEQSKGIMPDLLGLNLLEVDGVKEEKKQNETIKTNDAKKEEVKKEQKVEDDFFDSLANRKA